MLVYYLGFVNQANVLLCSINRFTMLYFTKYYSKIWNYGFYPIVLVILISPIPHHLPLLLEPSYFVFSLVTGTYFTATTANESLISTVLMIFILVVVIFNIILNSLCWHRITTLKYGLDASKAKDPHHTSFFANFFYMIARYSNDLLTLSHPWILLAVSSAINCKDSNSSLQTNIIAKYVISGSAIC
ncbi:unnamed protein product [Caenorhabditis bovis]|uniref:7TM GPCR serpentine receptor class x (Srx) domain-containing protein n=1 Tax=Caenorhabditis bovis TaxID=2654633 RepID=A0A8S1DYZ5_9PELO|nr:unnamed protein product [Caenorhabditis bovis]